MSNKGKLKPCNSKALYVQKIGRAKRNAEVSSDFKIDNSTTCKMPKEGRVIPVN